MNKTPPISDDVRRSTSTIFSLSWRAETIRVQDRNALSRQPRMMCTVRFETTSHGPIQTEQARDSDHPFRSPNSGTPRFSPFRQHRPPLSGCTRSPRLTMDASYDEVDTVLESEVAGEIEYLRLASEIRARRLEIQKINLSFSLVLP